MPEKRPGNCIDCEKPITRRAMRCGSCASKHRGQDKEYREKVSATMTALWQNQEYRVHQLMALRRGKGMVWRQKLSRYARGRKLSKETKKKISAGMKAVWDSGGSWIKQRNQNISQATKRNWEAGIYNNIFQTEKYRIKRQKQSIGENNANWRGGISFKPYPPEFNELLKARIRKRDKYLCALCGIKENRTHHSVHHIDYNKKNNAHGNLIALCVKCHGKTHYRRKFWTSVLTHTIKHKVKEND